MKFTDTLILGISLAVQAQDLRFNQNGKFKMVQFTDIHFGEDDKDDASNQKLMGEILDYEKPDLVIITGDVVSGYAWDGKTTPWASVQWTKGVQPMIDKGYRWASTCGNHDSQADLTREQVSELDVSFDLSMTLPNQGNISHSFNYWLPIYGQNDSDVHLRLWFLDSGDSACLEIKGYDCIRPDQVQWFREENYNIASSDPSKGKGLLFIHIPIDEYMDMYNKGSFYGYRDEDICCSSVNTGVFGALIEQPTVEWVSAGHDHDNDYYGYYEGVNLAYGRKTGYGGYGPDKFSRGARVFEVTQEPYGIESWIREEGGNKVIQTKPSVGGAFFHSQPQCCSMDSKWEKIHANSFKKEIVVINVSVVVGIVLIVMAGVCFWRYRKNKKLKSDQETAERAAKLENENDQLDQAEPNSIATSTPLLEQEIKHE